VHNTINHENITRHFSYILYRFVCLFVFYVYVFCFNTSMLAVTILYAWYNVNCFTVRTMLGYTIYILVLYYVSRSCHNIVMFIKYCRLINGFNLLSSNKTKFNANIKRRSIVSQKKKKNVNLYYIYDVIIMKIADAVI
jgi:hypothetical protein